MVFLWPRIEGSTFTPAAFIGSPNISAAMALFRMALSWGNLPRNSRLSLVDVPGTTWLLLGAIDVNPTTGRTIIPRRQSAPEAGGGHGLSAVLYRQRSSSFDGQ